jgi:hypothetical protein
MSNDTSSNGRLIVYVPKYKKGDTVEVRLNENTSSCVYANVVERNIDGEVRYAAVFPVLPVGNHMVHSHPHDKKFTVFADSLSEIDLR